MLEYQAEVRSVIGKLVNTIKTYHCKIDARKPKRASTSRNRAENSRKNGTAIKGTEDVNAPRAPRTIVRTVTGSHSLRIKIRNTETRNRAATASSIAPTPLTIAVSQQDALARSYPQH